MDHTTEIVVAVLCGFALGLAVSLLNGLVSRRAVAKGGSGALTVMMICRMGLDLAVLAGLYLLRNVIPLPFEPTLIGAATGLALGGVITAWRLSRRPERNDEEKK